MEDSEQHRLREKVRQAYAAAARRPTDGHPFPVGRKFAERLGYPPHLLDDLPSVTVEAFAGVSNVSVSAELPQRARVLDLGCGAGVDSLITARRLGRQGKVVGLDFGADMLERARCGAAQAGVANVQWIQAAAERLPIRTASIDVALVNGIFNLNPARSMIFRELARVLRPGATLFVAELILKEPLPPEVIRNEANWFA